MIMDRHEKKRIYMQIEEVLNAANSRCDGLLHTQDKQFAFAVSELLRDFFATFDALEDDVEQRELYASERVGEIEYSLKLAEQKLFKIEQHIKYTKSLKPIEDIMESSHDDD